jgi:hypothetical protein
VKNMIKEKSVIEQMYQLINTRSTLQNPYSYDFGELVLKLFDQLGIKRKLSLRGHFASETGESKDIIEIGDTYIEVICIDYNSELSTCASLSQHDVLSESDDLKDVLIYDDIELTKAESERILEKYCKPYMLERCGVSIESRNCQVNIPHNHYYVAFDSIFPKTLFNWCTYEDIKACMDKAISEAYDVLLAKGQPANSIIDT